MTKYSHSRQQIGVPADKAAGAPQCGPSFGIKPIVLLAVFAAMYAVLAAVLLSVTRL